MINFFKPPPSRHLVEPFAERLPDANPNGRFMSAFPFIDDAMTITGGFEGRGLSQVTGNFDGQGLSVGVLQWNYGTETLQNTILKPYMKLRGSIDKLGLFPGSLDVSASMTGPQAVAFAKRHMLIGSRVKLNWAKAWREFLLKDVVVELQSAGCSGVGERANGIMIEWGYNSKRAFCFFFDIVTQNGSLKGVQKSLPVKKTAYAILKDASKENQKIWAPLIETADDEQLVLFIAGHNRALKARREYIQDVFHRKGTIALGQGIVHGKHWHFFGPLIFKS